MFGFSWKSLGNWLKRALDIVEQIVPDETIKMALDWARVAAGKKELDNAQRREFVVALLVAHGIPESLARLATELAVQILKSERR